MDGWMGNVSSKQANDKQRINIKPSQPQMRCVISFISWLAYCMFYATKTKQTKKNRQNSQFLLILYHKYPNQTAALGFFPSRSYQVPLAPAAVAP